MSPIMIRPVREQLEHDRLIRHLEGQYSQRKLDVAINVGEERIAPVKIGTNTFYPDLVLTEGRKLAGVVEVESGESVNNLEALAQWVHFARAKVPFHLYVPVAAYDAARRLCEAHAAKVSEIWTYRGVLDGFDLVRMHQDAAAAATGTSRSAAGNGKARKSASRPAPARPAPAKPAPAKPAAVKTAPAKPGPTRAGKPAAKPARAKASKPAAKGGAKSRTAGKAKSPAKSSAKASRAKKRR